MIKIISQLDADDEIVNTKVQHIPGKDLKSELAAWYILEEILKDRKGNKNDNA